MNSPRRQRSFASVAIPLWQRGFVIAKLLAGDRSAGQARRTAGQRATQLLGQDNPLAAQSELAHFAGRNLGGWAGGAAAAYALGSSGAGPMVLIAADAYFLSVAGEKAAALLDNRAIYIQTDIANSPGAIAARYELAHHRNGWAADGLPMSPAVQQALPDPDALTASDGQRYCRNMDGQWTSHGAPPDGNRVLELETMRALLQPALAAQAQAIAAIRQSPPSAQDIQREQTQYRYRIVGTELQPQWRDAIELATRRTREAAGLSGDGALQLQRGPGGTFDTDSPIVHLHRGVRTYKSRMLAAPAC